MKKLLCLMFVVSVAGCQQSNVNSNVNNTNQLNSSADEQLKEVDTDLGLEYGLIDFLTTQYENSCDPVSINDEKFKPLDSSTDEKLIYSVNMEDGGSLSVAINLLENNQNAGRYELIQGSISCASGSNPIEQPSRPIENPADNQLLQVDEDFGLEVGLIDFLTTQYENNCDPVSINEEFFEPLENSTDEKLFYSVYMEDGGSIDVIINIKNMNVNEGRYEVVQDSIICAE